VNNPQQLIFPFKADQRASFSNFFCTQENSGLLSRLDQIVNAENSHELIIDGLEGSGKSFLIQSICNELSLAQKKLAFIPMKKALNMDEEIIQNLASLDAVCIDDIQCIENNAKWEEAFFHLINECHQSQCTLIFSVTSNKSLDDLFKLPDLLSRFKRMEHMTLKSVQDQDLMEALIFNCKNLDINLAQSELEFLVKYHVRDFSILLEKIIFLDQRAGELKRKITIPLIKEILSL
jgi:DnaA family protein